MTENLPATIPPEQVDLAERYQEELDRAIAATGCDLQTWYLGKEAEFAGLEAAIKKQADIMLAQVAARRKSLQWRFGQVFRLAVEQDLQNQKGSKKSVDYATGRAGFRATRDKVTILDAEALTEWCLNNCEAALALKIARTTPIMDHIKSTGEVPPGCRFDVKQDKFYPSVDAMALPKGDNDDDGTGEV